jgi:pimeloyl-ACP methyl ester carboxylesterase
MLVRKLSLTAILLLLASNAAGQAKQVTGLQAIHQAGQTRLVFHEVDSPVTESEIAAIELRDRRREAERSQHVRYRVYRSAKPIRSLDGLQPIAVVPPLTCWNIDYYGSLRPQHRALRYVVENGTEPLPPGSGIVAYDPAEAGPAYYAVTAVIDGRENERLDAANSLAQPVQETLGPGEPVLQRTERPESFAYVKEPTLHYYVRWEAPPNASIQGKPIDYLVAVPPEPAEPAPVGIHLHCWGGSLNGGYGWWYQAEQGHLLLASNQVPYDWWTGYHEQYWEEPAEKESWQDGVVRPYSQRRLLSFLQWMSGQWEIDLSRTHVAGNSMGGSGAPMFAIRHPDKIAWANGWVGVHIPHLSPTFRSSYENVYGPPEWNVKFEDGTPVWDYFNDAWYLREHPDAEIGLICFSNGKNDSGIGWKQAVLFHRALQETRRPHVFVWGQSGHSQRAKLPVSLSDRRMPMDLRVDQSQPAFTGCSLDDDPGDGEPADGDPEGQSNRYLYWETEEVVDREDRWAMTLGLAPQAPEDRCTVDVTPRRLQQFRLQPEAVVRWTNHDSSSGQMVQEGEATADSSGLVTLPEVIVTKQKNRIEIQGAKRP